MHFSRIKSGETAPVILPYLEWQRFDGTSYVPVGGMSVSYLSVSPLFEPTERTGRVQCGSYRTKETGGIELIPQGEFKPDGNGGEVFIPADGAADDRAFIVVPSGAYDFDTRGVEAYHPRERMACMFIVLNPGESVRAMPKVRTIREMETVKPMVLAYHGHGNLSFCEAEAAVAA